MLVVGGWLLAFVFLLRLASFGVHVVGCSCRHDGEYRGGQTHTTRAAEDVMGDGLDAVSLQQHCVTQQQAGWLAPVSYQLR